MLKRAANGTVLAQSFAEKYPTGRKHCACCTRWRHVIDFAPAKWLDAGKTIALKLMAYCRVCQAEKQRQRTGCSRRTVFNGQIGTESYRLRRAARKREHYYEQRKDPVWVQNRRDYENERNRLKREAAKKKIGRGEIDAARFVEYLDRWTIKQDIPGAEDKLFLNGFYLTDNDARMIRRWRRGGTMLLKTADAWAVRFDLPFWEIEDEATIAA